MENLWQSIQWAILAYVNDQFLAYFAPDFQPVLSQFGGQFSAY